MELLKNITSSNMNNFETLLESCFDVQKIQLTTDYSDFNNPNAYGIYKKDGGNCLGVVGSNFTPVQPKIIANSLLDLDVDFSSIKFETMKNESKFRFDIPLKENISFVNKFGKEDTTNLKICLQSGFDGKTKTSLFIYTERLVCLNGAKANFTEYSVNFKNVKGNQGKLLGLVHGFEKVKNDIKKLNDFYISLNKVEINEEVKNQYLKDVLNLDKDNLTGKNKKIYSDVMESFELEIDRTGNTLFGMFNGLTHYVNHKAVGSKNPDFTYTENGERIIKKSEKFLLEMV
jgi:hypothetical protein